MLLEADIASQSLINARSDTDDLSVFLSSKAVMFFATPHRGLLTDDIQAMIGEDSPRKDLVKSLEDATVDETKFAACVESIKVVSFNETKQTRRLKKVCQIFVAHIFLAKS